MNTISITHASEVGTSTIAENVASSSGASRKRGFRLLDEPKVTNFLSTNALSDLKLSRSIPILTHGITAVNETTIHSICPSYVRLHHRKNLFELTFVKRIVQTL